MIDTKKYLSIPLSSISPHYGSFRRNRRILCNASKLPFEPLHFPRAIITTQIDWANAAIITAANFSSMEYEGFYIDNEIRIVCFSKERSAIT